MKGIYGSIALALFVAACTPAAAPSKSATVTPEEIRSKTVALVSPVYQDPESEDESRSFKSFDAYCSGVWVSENEILSANHCVSDKAVGDWVFFSQSEDVFTDGTILRHVVMARSASLKRRDSKHDLALLEAEPGPQHGTATVSTDVKIGEPAEAMGQSLGILWWTYSSGIVSSIRQLDPEILAKGPLDPNMTWVQTTAPVSGGNSGGGLFDVSGNLIGVCHGGFRAGQNLNIYIHPSYVSEFLSQK